MEVNIPRQISFVSLYFVQFEGSSISFEFYLVCYITHHYILEYDIWCPQYFVYVIIGCICSSMDAQGKTDDVIGPILSIYMTSMACSQLSEVNKYGRQYEKFAFQIFFDPIDIF